MVSAANVSTKPRRLPLPTIPVYRFTVEQYHRMIEQGILTEHDRVELLEGWIAPKMTHNPPHDCSVLLGQTELLSRLSADWIVRVQSAITTRDSEPEPDLVMARGPARRYARAHPKQDDIALLIEVADSTLEDDRLEKARLYARARIAMYWIINLIDLQVEVYTVPKTGRSPAYRQRRDYSIKDSIPLLIEGQNFGLISVRDLLP
ncbi:MAG TPA: Uma2 family endonuclease [Gemmataceae bacterium]|nr:Uma2 family endonuclease [Gemmataceae bacterium]